MDLVYVARNKAIKASVSLYTCEQGVVTRNALLDSGATECFINPRLVQKLQLPTTKLKTPRKVRNIDRSLDKSRTVTEVVLLNMTHEDHAARHAFFVADIGADELILGYPFFKVVNPLIDWATGKTMGTVTLRTPPLMPSEITLQKTMVVQQLTEQAADKKKQNWDELVPTQYHKFGKVFSEAESEQFPGKMRWDHAIDLRPDAPASIDMRVYPLSPAEKAEQAVFLATNKWLQ